MIKHNMTIINLWGRGERDQNLHILFLLVVDFLLLAHHWKQKRNSTNTIFMHFHKDCNFKYSISQFLQVKSQKNPSSLQSTQSWHTLLLYELLHDAQHLSKNIRTFNVYCDANLQKLALHKP